MTSSANYKPPAPAADATTGSHGTTTATSSSSSTMASPQQQQQQQQIQNHAQAPHSPNLPSRIASVMIMGLTGIISRTFLYGLNDVEVKGLDRFKQLLDSREDPERRERGLLTGVLMKSTTTCKSVHANSVKCSLQPYQCVSASSP